MVWFCMFVLVVFCVTVYVSGSAGRRMVGRSVYVFWVFSVVSASRTCIVCVRLGVVEKSAGLSVTSCQSGRVGIVMLCFC